MVAGSASYAEAKVGLGARPLVWLADNVFVVSTEPVAQMSAA
jgi:hypothetical protein